MGVKTAAGKKKVQIAPQPKSRVALLKFLIICLPLWLSVKFYGGPYHEQVRNYLAGILFIIICGLVVQIVLPKLQESSLLITLFFVFCAVELVNWQIPGLMQGITLTVADNTLLGGNYSLHKIPYYGVGAFIGYFILKACRR